MTTNGRGSLRHAALIKPERITFERFVLGNLTRRGSRQKGARLPATFDSPSAFGSHALRYDEALRFGEDYILYARALAAGARFVVIPTPGYVAVKRADWLQRATWSTRFQGAGNQRSQVDDDPHLTASERDALIKHHADIERRAQWLVVVEALQSRNYPKLLTTFFRSPALTQYLTARLMAESPLQIRRRLRRRRGR